ncbi:MAG: diguanylate cyclase, partial [Cyanobacteria bacterium RYN_339]|nr:diguanylate cyclase [Cyanobacteria bacterium RYN_339]
LWAGGFCLSYVAGFAVLAGFGMPSGTAPLVSGVLTAAVFQLLGRRNRPLAYPARPHLRALDRFSRELDDVTDADQLAALVIGTLGKTIAVERVFLWLPGRNQRDFHLAAGLGPDPGEAVLPEAWLHAYVQPRDRDVDGHEVPAALDQWMTHRQLASGTPIHAHGRLVGLITCGFKPDGLMPDESDRWLVGQVARQAGLALSYLGLQKVERKRRSKMDNLTHLYKLAQKRAITDGLTGLNTHVYFKEQLAKRFSEARRHQEALSMALVDIDHFKKVNDTYGHPVGDEVLRRVAAAIKAMSRTDDTVARYGGEELSLVLPQTDLEGAHVLAERIREAVAALQAGPGQRMPSVTVSVGVAQMEPGDESHAGLIERADRALYAAKRQGRNKVCIAS